jgi:TPR repeat protein
MLKNISIKIFIILVISCLIGSSNDEIDKQKTLILMQEIINKNFVDTNNTLSNNAKQSCDNGEIKGCIAIAAMFNLGQGGLLKNEEVALKLFKTACKADISKGCILEGSIYLQGKQSLRDYDKAFKIFDQECKKNNMTACVVIGSMYENGEGRKVNLEKARKFYSIACNNKTLEGCLGLKQVVKKLYQKKPITVIGNKMWQDEPYTREEVKVYVDWMNKPIEGIGKALTWKQAKVYCQNLSLENFNDWYLPTKEDLMILYINQNMLKNVVKQHFWSSSLLYPNIKNSTVYDVYMEDGRSYKANPFAIDFVRCVRNINKKHFNNISKQWITPNRKNCVFFEGKFKDGACMNSWYKAEKICRSLNARLPSIEELSKVVINCGGVLNDARHINENSLNYQTCYQKKGFVSGYSNHYWSSTPHENGSSYMSIMIFDNGNIFHNIKERNSYVRCIKVK